MDRISEVLFGLIMALTFTCTLGVAAAEVRTMLIGALGCNLAWGIIDSGVHLLARINEGGRAIVNWRAVRDAADVDTAQRIVANALPPLLASVLAPAQLEFMRQKLAQLPEPARPRLTKSDWLGALAICLLSFPVFFLHFPSLFHFYSSRTRGWRCARRMRSRLQCCSSADSHSAAMPDFGR
jgi:hypothetical protein